MPTQNETPFVIMTAEVMALANIKFSDNFLFKSATDFSLFIESEAVKQDKTCTDIILKYCDEKDIEPDAIAKHINNSLKGKIEQEMIETGLMDSRSTLEGF